MRIVKKPQEEREVTLPSLLDEFFSDSWLLSPFRKHREEGWVPALDISEDDKAIHIEAEIPGMDEKNIKVELSNGYLTITGEKKEEEEKKTKRTYRLERRFGSFSRTIPVGEDIQEEKIDAVCKKGVLKITLPKTQTAKPKLIKIAHEE